MNYQMLVVSNVTNLLHGCVWNVSKNMTRLVSYVTIMLMDIHTRNMVNRYHWSILPDLVCVVIKARLSLHINQNAQQNGADRPLSVPSVPHLR